MTNSRKVKATNIHTGKIIKANSINELVQKCNMSRASITKGLATGRIIKGAYKIEYNDTVIKKRNNSNSIAIKATHVITKESFIIKNKFAAEKMFDISRTKLDKAIKDGTPINGYILTDHVQECLDNLTRAIQKQEATENKNTTITFTLDQIANSYNKSKEELIEIIKNNFDNDKDFEPKTIIIDYNVNIDALVKLEKVV